VDTVPPASTPGEIGSPIEIKFNRAGPSYSAIASQVSKTSVVGLLIGIVLVLQGAVSLVQGRNSASPTSNTGVSTVAGNPPAISQATRRINCPACGKGLIRFWQWAHGLNAFFYQCPHCGSKLRAAKPVIAGFVCALLMIPLYIWAASALSRLTNWSADLWFTVIVVAGSAVLAYATWRIARYTVRAKTIENSNRAVRMEGLQNRDHF
jgi:predicted RNA-binding Zn-ribbon protein involved in translation (DUF1610 family)